MTNNLNNNFEQYITMYASEPQFMVGQAHGLDDKETSGLLYGFFTQARRLVIMLAVPGGDTYNGAAKCSMDPDYTTRLSEYLLDKYGLPCVGNWHSHGSIQMHHSSSGDVNQMHQWAIRENLETMLQIVITRQNITTANQQPARSSGIKDKFLNITKLTDSETDTKKEKRLADRDNRPKMKVNVCFYPQAKTGSYICCPIRVLPGKSPFRKELEGTGILDIPGKPRFEKYPFEKIIYDEVMAVPQTATERYIPHILAKQLDGFSDEIIRQTEICMCDEGQITLSMPLPNKHRLCATYIVKESQPRIHSVTVFFQDTKTIVDLTKEILMHDDNSTLGSIYKQVVNRVKASKIKRITHFIYRNQDIASKFHKNKAVQ